MQNFLRSLLSASLLLFVSPHSHAIELIEGLGGVSGFGQSVMLPNDDGSSSQLNLPFEVDFFGNTYSTFFINNNGNVTFNGPLFEFTPVPFPIADRPMLAPYWGDVDTRTQGRIEDGQTVGPVYVAEGQTVHPNDTVIVTWNDVGYYDRHTDKTNNFQLVIRERGDTGPGNFDVDFRYDRLEWTTGDASGGTGGLGGVPAQAGFDAGDLENFLSLPGSLTGAVLDLQHLSNVSPGTPGLWTFAFREGVPPNGSRPGNPLLPIVTDDGFEFDFNIELNQRIFIDPDAAVGYDFVVDSGPNFASVLIPDLLADDTFTLVVNGFSTVLPAETVFDFTSLDPNGVSSFGIRGIDPALGLDPMDPTAFVTGLTFVTAGHVAMRQIAVTNQPPDCAQATPETHLLWPPNHEFRDVSISGVTDPDGDPVSIAITSILQDEPTAGPGKGSCPDAAGIGGNVASLRVERDGRGDGRVYRVGFDAHDQEGGACSGLVRVCVPHDQGDADCVNQTALFDSTTCVDPARGRR